jgi:hypothetical protein
VSLEASNYLTAYFVSHDTVAFQTILCGVTIARPGCFGSVLVDVSFSSFHNYLPFGSFVKSVL